MLLSSGYAPRFNTWGEVLVGKGLLLSESSMGKEICVWAVEREFLNSLLLETVLRIPVLKDMLYFLNNILFKIKGKKNPASSTKKHVVSQDNQGKTLLCITLWGIWRWGIITVFFLFFIFVSTFWNGISLYAHKKMLLRKHRNGYQSTVFLLFLWNYG